MSNLLRLLAYGLGLAMAGGCSLASQTCTTIGCRDGTGVRFQTADGTWPAGSYRIEVTADGATGACDVRLPLPACGTPASSCSGTRAWILGESGCALPTDQHAISGINFDGTTPTRIDVAVSRDGRQLAAQSFTPTYATLRPNGPDCDPTCRTAPLASLQLTP